MITCLLTISNEFYIQFIYKEYLLSHIYCLEWRLFKPRRLDLDMTVNNANGDAKAQIDTLKTFVWRFERSKK